MSNDKNQDRAGSGTLMGSLRDALAAAAAPQKPASASAQSKSLPIPSASVEPHAAVPVAQPMAPEPVPTAAEAARAARGETARPDVETAQTKLPPRPGAPLRTAAPKDGAPKEGAARTQLIRGKISVKRTDFYQDPVVGWLVVVGGQGLGAFRPIYEGNNTMGRGKNQRIAIDFGDETISNEEQAYIRYDSVDRKFLLVPNLAKTNVVAVNDRKPTGAVELSAMDLITIGRTQLVFVPFCGQDFDWAELSEMKG